MRSVGGKGEEESYSWAKVDTIPDTIPNTIPNFIQAHQAQAGPEAFPAHQKKTSPYPPTANARRLRQPSTDKAQTCQLS